MGPTIRALSPGSLPRTPWSVCCPPMQRSYRPLALVLLALALGTWLRLWFLWHFPQVNGDGLTYGDIAKNWLCHSIYGRTVYAAAGATIHPTLIRLPGYPLFLAASFRIFGV